MNKETEIIKMPSGHIINLSQDVYADCFLNFDEAKETIFYAMIQSGHYFPQIMQFIFVMVGLCTGHASFGSVVLFSLLFGTVSMILWFLLKLHMIPGINVLCTVIGGTFFRFKIHWIAIIAVALLFVGDWKVILFYIAASLLTGFIKTILFAKLSNTKYNDSIAVKVSRFRTDIRNMEH